MNIGIKYCGGCDERYDRIKFVKDLKKLIPEFDFENVSDGISYDSVVIISGCAKNCADILNLKSTMNFIYVDHESRLVVIADRLKNHLIKKGEQND